MRFVIRVDDIGFTADAIEPSPLKRPDAGLEHAQRFHLAMQGVPYLAAVIPSCVDRDGGQWLYSQPAGMTIALHGLQHTRVDGVDSEYRGKSVDQCRAMLAEGMRLIGAGQIVHTVPPFNGCEPELIEACYHEGIRYIWGGASHDTREPSRWPTCPPPYPVCRVTFVPSWKPLYGATRWRMVSEDVPLLEALPALLRQSARAVITIHLPWELAKSPTLDGVRALADLIGDRVMTPEEYVAA